MDYHIDLNCDMGESFGAYKLGNDWDMLDYVTSANIACGFHAGDPTTMRNSVQMALLKNVGIGAHPGIYDLIGFGRREIELTPRDAYDIVVYQIGALSAFIKAEGGKLQHVKPHGALYNMAARSAPLSEAIAEAVYKVDSELILFGLSGSELIKAGNKIGLRVANEVFSDRSYNSNGTLTSRKESNAFITDFTTGTDRVIRMIKENQVQTTKGDNLEIQAETICIHGDGDNPVEFVRRMSVALQNSGIEIRNIGL